MNVADRLKKRVARECPPSGVFGFLNEKAEDGTEWIKSKFSALPLSSNTQSSLSKNGFTTMTQV
jgi:hypothetical protein